VNNSGRSISIMNFLILGFFLGQIVAIAINHEICAVNGDNFSGLLMIFCLVLLVANHLTKRISCFLPNKNPSFWARQNIVLLLLGFIWGYPNQTSSPRYYSDNVVVVAAARSIYPDQKKWLCVYDGSKVFLARGQGKKSDVGKSFIGKSNDVFKLSQAIFVSTKSQAVKTERTFVDRQSRNLRDYFLSKIYDMPAKISRWYSAMLLGKISDLEKDEIKNFKLTGTLHLLVVSGLHIGMFSFFVGQFLLFPFRILYVIGLVQVSTWVALKKIAVLAAISLSTIYVGAVGFSIPTQRALLIFSVMQISKIFFGSVPIMLRIRAVLLFQIVLFPVGFISNSSFLSWGAFLLVLYFSLSLTSKVSRFSRVLSIAELQLALLGLTVTFFANASFAGLIVNVFAVPIFSFIFASALFSTIFPLPIILRMTVETFQLWFLDILEILGDLVKSYPWLFQENLNWKIRIFTLFLTFFFTLKFFKKLSIRSL